MPNKKIYYSEEAESPELTIHRNKDGNLFVCLSDVIDISNELSVVLTQEDAEELITDLAYQFGMLEDDPDRMFMPTWKR